MNKVIMIGRLTRDPEVRYSQGGTPSAVARFSLAVDRRFKKEGQPTADFFECTAFGKQGEFVERYLRKGTKVAIVGSIQNNNYKNKEGQMIYSMQVITDEIEFAESKAADQGKQDKPEEAHGIGIGDGFMAIPDGLEDEDLPFN
jgi:single-strand DNA-binding protein